MPDDFASLQAGLDSPGSHIALVAPNDSTDLTKASRGLLIGGSGTLKITTVGGETITIPATCVPAGGVLPLRVTRVWATGTTATDIHSIW